FNGMYPKVAARAARGGRMIVNDLRVPSAVRDFSMVAPRGCIVCIAGQLGSGANMVTRALAGLIPSATGNVMVDGRPMRLGSVPHCVGRNVLFIPDDRAAEGLFPQLTVLDNLVAGRLDVGVRMGVRSLRAVRRSGAGLGRRRGCDREQLAA